MKGLRFIHPLRGRRLVTVCNSEHGSGRLHLIPDTYGLGGRAISQTRYRGHNHEELEIRALRLQQQSSVGGAARVAGSRRSPLLLPAVAMPRTSPVRFRINFGWSRRRRQTYLTQGSGSGSGGGGWKASPPPRFALQAPHSRSMRSTRNTRCRTQRTEGCFVGAHRGGVARGQTRTLGTQSRAIGSLAQRHPWGGPGSAARRAILRT